MAEKEKTVEIIVSGRVQGVGYRFYTSHRAALLQIRGWVRNLADGSVKVIARGSNLDEFISYLRQGPLMARVDNLEVREINDPEIYENFQIR